MPDALIPRRCEIVTPGEIENLRAKAGRDFFGPVRRAGIDNDGFIDKIRGRLQAIGKRGFFVSNHQAEGYGHGWFLLLDVRKMNVPWYVGFFIWRCLRWSLENAGNGRQLGFGFQQSWIIISIGTNGGSLAKRRRPKASRAL